MKKRTYYFKNKLHPNKTIKIDMVQIKRPIKFDNIFKKNYLNIEDILNNNNNNKKDNNEKNKINEDDEEIDHLAPKTEIKKNIKKTKENLLSYIFLM